MDHTEKLTRYTANFVDEMVRSGLRHVVISPGSRSTPLAVLCRAHKEIQDWVLVDERSAAYFALGIAKKSGESVAIVCTSGTAAANYFPAVVEAYHARVPLIVLTADRPHELRGIGASQTIDQLNLFGTYVKDFQEMALPEASEEMLQYVRNRAARTVRLARQNNPGPVHVNFPFREPLMPDVDLPQLWGGRDAAFNESVEGKKRLSEQALKQLAEELSTSGNGLIVCGPDTGEAHIEAIARLAEVLQVPVLADPLSQMRTGSHDKTNVIAGYDAMFRHQELREKLKPDYIIRFGAMPISKSYLFYAKEHAGCVQYVVESYDLVREPTNHASTYLFSDYTALCEDLTEKVAPSRGTDWIKKWQSLEKNTLETLCQVNSTGLTEGEATRMICELQLDGHDLFVANSMPVRDMDNFLIPSEKTIPLHANRGVSGIDGVTSSALGVAAAAGKRVTLLIGDLSFYHDMNGLLAAKQYELDLTIVLINNNGGGIFSFLPQAKQADQFEALFGTPLDLDFAKAVSLYHGQFHRVNDKQQFADIFTRSNHEKGLVVIEVCTDRTENVKWHEDVWKQVRQGLMKNEW